MGKKASKSSRISVLLHNIRSVYNVGSVFRTADAFGVEKIYISGYTPSPTDRFGRIRADVAKVALGAEKTVPWKTVVSNGKSSESGVIDFVAKFKKEGGKIVVLEQDEKSVTFGKLRDMLFSPAPPADILLILGNEVAGVEKNLLSEADYIVEIPMRGKKESLNVSVSAGIALFELITG